MQESKELFSTKTYLDYLFDFITPERKTRLLDVLSRRTKHITFVVEDVYQLHNASAVMRSCEVFGIQELHVIEQRYGKKIDKEIAMGAQKWVDITRFATSEESINVLRNKGYSIVVASPHETSCTVDALDLSKPVAIYMGNEKTGVSEYVINQADSHVHIPMYGFTESLNVSVAAAILAQQLSERLRSSGIDWKLSEEEYFLKTIDWVENSIRSLKDVQDRYVEISKR